jgi:hypothetical protein
VDHFFTLVGQLTALPLLRFSLPLRGIRVTVRDVMRDRGFAGSAAGQLCYRIFCLISKIL